MPSHPNYFDLLCKMNVWNWLVWSGEWNIGRGKKLKKTKKTTTLLWCLRRRRHRRRRNRYRRSACHLVSREILKKTFFVSVIVLCLIIYIVFKTTVLWHVEEQAVCWVSSVSVMFSNAFELAPPPSTSRVCTSLSVWLLTLQWFLRWSVGGKRNEWLCTFYGSMSRRLLFEIDRKRTWIDKEKRK